MPSLLPTSRNSNRINKHLRRNSQCLNATGLKYVFATQRAFLSALERFAPLQVIDVNKIQIKIDCSPSEFRGESQCIEEFPRRRDPFL